MSEKKRGVLRKCAVRGLLVTALALSAEAWGGTSRALLVHPDEFTDNWIRRASALGVQTLAVHPAGGGYAPYLTQFLTLCGTDEFRARIDRARAAGLSVSYELHAGSWLVPRELFAEHPEYFRMDAEGKRTEKCNFCASNKDALALAGRRVQELVRALYRSDHRYYIWLDDVAGASCRCPSCARFSPSDQQLLVLNALLADVRKVDPAAKLAYLAYYDTMGVPKAVRPAPGVFLEYAPITRAWDRPLAEQDAVKEKDVAALLAYFGTADARVLEYWYDNSLFSKWQKPPRRFVPREDVIRADIAWYERLGFEEIASFACYLGPDYEAHWGEPDVSAFRPDGEILFRGFHGEFGGRDRTAFRCWRDGDRVRFAFNVWDETVCAAPSDKDERDVSWCDRVEVFFAKEASLTTPYCSIEVDPLGHVLDYKKRVGSDEDFSWQAKTLKVRALVVPGGYEVEGSVAADELAAAGIDLRSFFFGAFRADYAPDRQLVGWYSARPPDGRFANFHQPNMFLPASLPEGVASGATVGEPVESGEDSWGGRLSHPAAVNAVGCENDPNVIRLRGKWEFCASQTPKYLYHRKDFDAKMAKESREVDVPGCWEASGIGRPGSGIVGSTWGKAWQFKACHTGSGYYRKRVTIPAEWKGKRIWLKEGGVRNVAWFWLNQAGVGMVCDNHGSRKWEVTSVARPGAENTVFVEVNNEYPCRNTGAMAYHNWGGLVRDVELEATPQVYIDDAWVRGDYDGRRAEAHVVVGGLRCLRGSEGLGGSDGSGGLRVRVTIEDETVESTLQTSQTPQTSQTLKIPLRNFHPWSPEHPNLYWAKIELVEDGQVTMTRRERFGVRKFEIRGDKEFYLNGRPYFLRGFGDDSVYPLTGFSPASREEHLKHLTAAHRAGFNYVRTHTHCELPEYFEAADEAGIIVEAELSYYRDLPSEQLFPFDPVKDARIIMENYRRYPSLGIYSGGNEGSLGPVAGKLLRRFLKRNDPDRLVVEQDGGWSTSPELNDFVGGPMNPWKRGCVRSRTFVCHEYLNLAVKDDYRNASKYVGVTLPLTTPEMRRAELVKAKLDDAWGERLQDAQHALQGYWQKNGIEHARKDPFCDGFCFWTIVDFSHRGASLKEYPRAQGYFNQFWEPKIGGLAPEEFAVFNSASCLLIDTEGIVRDFACREDRTSCGLYDKGIVTEETNRVYSAGSEIPVEFMLAHYGDASIGNARLKWSFVDPSGKAVLTGGREVGPQAVGAVRTLAKERIRVPEVERPVKAKLVVEMAGIANAWDFYFVPRLEKVDCPESVVVAKLGSSEAAAARKAGRNLLVHADTTGMLNIYPNWWDFTWGDRDITGAAAVPHEVWGDFPFEARLAPNLMRIFRKGTTMPVEGFTPADAVMITEGCKRFALNLAAKRRPDGGKEVFVSGLDVFSDTPEAKLLLKNIYAWLAK